LLRKAKVIASKLKVKEFEAWIDSELGGYKGRLVDLPPHRVGLGQPKFFNPYHGWLDIVVGDDELSEMISAARLPQPVAELEELLRSGKSTHVILGYPPMIIDFLNKINDSQFNYGLHVSKSFIHGALDHAKNTTLEWTLKLEEQGITGEGLRFSDEERAVAQVVTNHIYNSNVGVVGSVRGDAVNSRFVMKSGAVNSDALMKLTQQIREAAPGLPKTASAAIERKLDELDEATREQDASRVASTLSSIRTVLEGAAGSLAASGILAAISGAGA
jgi:hypothetical protein